jgi:hypothetical protein
MRVAYFDEAGIAAEAQEPYLALRTIFSFTPPVCSAITKAIRN